jgi:hypothetical protein
MAKEQKGPHRLAHNEGSLLMPVELRSLAKGDVCVRQGAPCMIVEPQASVPREEGKVWICNLQTGSVWEASGSEQVHPAREVMLDFKCARVCHS